MAKKFLTLRINEVGVYDVNAPRVRSNNTPPNRDSRECPAHLFEMLRAKQFWYYETDSYRTVPATFVRVQWWRDTQEWVGVYSSVFVFGAGPHGLRWEERYIWTKRRSDWIELKQFGVRGVGWRKSRYPGF